MKNKSFLNLAFNMLSLVISIGLSFWITPFIIKSLGAESYGFVPLTQQLINYMTVLTASITAMSGRFFTIAKKRNDMATAQEYFSTTLTAGLVGSVFLTIPLVIGSIYINKILNIPPSLIGDVRIAFLLYGGIFVLTFLTSGFNNGAFANNKLYITSSISIVNILTKTIFTISFLVLLTPHIWYISLANLIATFVVFVITVFVFTKIEPQINIKKLGFKRLKELLSAGCWISLNEIGVILFLQIDLLVANWCLGARLAGEYAVVLQLPTILRTFSGTIISVFPPTIISLYAMDKIKDMIKYVNNAVKYTGLVLALPIGIVCGFGGIVLSLWINPHFKQYGFILFVLAVHLSINLSVQTIMSVQTALNKVKIPAFVTIVMGAMNFILAYTFAGSLKMGAFGIALAGSIVLTSKNLIFSPIYVAHITKQPWYTYFKGVTKPLVATLFVAFLCFGISHYYNIDSFLKLLLVSAIVGVVYLFVAYFAFINKSERVFINDNLMKRLKRAEGK